MQVAMLVGSLEAGDFTIERIVVALQKPNVSSESGDLALERIDLGVDLHGG